MGQPYVGEIRMFAGSFAPNGWMLCQGQLLPISENDVLFNLIGTTYGGDGQETFALPNLQSRVPMHAGNGFTLGESGGVEEVTLTTNQIPSHLHVPQGNAAAAGQNSGTAVSPANGVWATQQSLQQFAPGPANANMNAGVIQPAGGSQPHDNMIPYLCINFIISLYGVYPHQ